MFGRIAAKSALFLLAASVGPAPASATEYLTTSVVGVFYGVETVLSPADAVVSVTDVETAETGLGSFVAPTPADISPSSQRSCRRLRAIRSPPMLTFHPTCSRPLALWQTPTALALSATALS